VTLSTIAKEVSKWENIKNVDFICSDYNTWFTTNHATFDVIFSFAVHIWLNVTPEVYSKQLRSILNPNGYLLFESQTLETDKMFDAFCEAFEENGFSKRSEHLLCDDGQTNRKLVIFQVQ